MNSLTGRPDIPHDQLAEITNCFGPHAPVLETSGDPLTRLLCLFTEAKTSLLWNAQDSRQGQDALAEGLTLLESLPLPRPPQAVIGLLRLTRDLVADTWLNEHTDAFRTTITAGGLHRLHPTDIDWLQIRAHPKPCYWLQPMLTRTLGRLTLAVTCLHQAGSRTAGAGFVAFNSDIGYARSGRFQITSIRVRNPSSASSPGEGGRLS
ncbi:hypothetical protein [Streptomyces aureus]|uniref:hypothetical protein n=1 Tax=Streptomyces aureus TaxID=193461 RepID=UPI00340314EB